MNDPVDDLMDRMARHIAPADPAKQDELRAAWRVNPKVMDDFLFHAARGYDPERFTERLRGLIAGHDAFLGGGGC